DNENAAEMPQKDDVSKCNENDFLNERRAQRVYGVPDERAAIIKRRNVDAFGETRLHVTDLLLNSVNDVKRSRAIPDDDYATSRVPAISVEHTAPEIWPHLNGCDVAHIHRRTIH